MELAGWNLLERRRVKNVIDATSGIQDALVITNITNIELQLGARVMLTHVILLFFIPTKYANLGNIGIKKALQDSITKGPGTTGDQKRLILKHNILTTLFVSNSHKKTHIFCL
ncbi:hypothetical protein D3C81_1519190 [compost metagenome]